MGDFVKTSDSFCSFFVDLLHCKPGLCEKRQSVVFGSRKKKKKEIIMVLTGAKANYLKKI
jgi:hypothetical protein